MSLSLGLCLRLVRNARPLYSPPSLCFGSRCNSKFLSSLCLGENVLQQQHQHNLTCRRFASSSPIIDKLGKEIYFGPLATRIRSVKLFSLTSSFFGLLMQPVLLQKILEHETSLVVIVVSGVILEFFTFITPLLLHYICKRYVKSIHFDADTDTYTAITYNFWTVNKLLPFKVDDVVVPDIPGMFTSVIVKGTPLFIEANYFDDIHHYKRMMGFDKPIDFRLEEKSKE